MVSANGADYRADKEELAQLCAAVDERYGPGFSASVLPA